MKNIYVLLFILLSSYITICGQELKVTSASTLEPISDVAIFNNRVGFSALTDEEGQVILAGFTQQDTVYFQHPSFYELAIPYSKVANKNFSVTLIEKIVYLEEYVVSVSKTKEKVSTIPSKVEVIRENEITFSNTQTSADVLENTGTVFVQKSQMGGGSPIIRGFEANKVLIVVDGVRMNNAIYRSGHLQNVITVDNAMLDRTEIVFGPGSLIYGSDALGGVMHFYTKQPQLGYKDSANVQGSAFTRFGSANLEKTGHFDFNMGFSKIASLTSVSFSDYDDSRIGSSQNEFYKNFGKRYYYAETENGVDMQLENDDPLVQKGTGYSQLDIMQKFLVPLGKDYDLTFNYQFSSSSNVPRYDRLRETSSVEVTDTIGIIVQPDTTIHVDSTYEVEELRYAQWDYGPQKRHFVSARLDFKTPKSLYDDGSLIAAYQKVHEERITRRFGNPNRTNRLEEVDIFTVNLDLNKKLSAKQAVQYGFEAVYNHVASTASSTNVITGEIGDASSRYPEGGSTMQTYSAYIKYNINISDKVFISPGFRYSLILLNSKFDDTGFFEFAFNEINVNTSAFSGALGIVAKPHPSWKLNFLLSTGYRSPNVDDVGKVFDPNPFEVVVPNENLDPEYAYNIEVGVTKVFAEKIEVSGLFFNTLIKNAIIRQPFVLNNQDSILYEGVLSRVYANVNTGTAVIRGVTFSIKADLTQHLSVSSSFNYTYGKDETNDTRLAHIPPMFGATSITYKQGRFKGAFVVKYNGWKRLEDYSPSGEDNLSDATELGTPAWYTLNLRTAYQFNEHFRLQFAIDNILDHHYRPFSSGVSAFGRNFIVMARVTF